MILNRTILQKWAFVKGSSYRVEILKILAACKMETPTGIAKKAGLRPQNISSYLIQLKDEGIVECVNDEVTKPRFYTLTKVGNEIFKNL